MHANVIDFAYLSLSPLTHLLLSKFYDDDHDDDGLSQSEWGVVGDGDGKKAHQKVTHKGNFQQKKESKTGATG